jgi:ribosomal-protein-alanine N-acetyltransferase
MIELRPLTLSELGQIEKIERRSYPTPWSRSMFAGELAKPSSHCVGAFDRDRRSLAAYMIVSRYVDAWHIMNLAVDGPYRGRGLARRLLDHLFAATAGDAMRGYTLEVRVSNARAIHLYEAAGFRTTGVRRGYYTDNREDAFVMWKDPIPAVEDDARDVSTSRGAGQVLEERRA